MAWLFLAYPLLAHLATLIRSQTLAWLALIVFFAVPLLPKLKARSAYAWLAMLAVAAALYGCARAGWAHLLMYLPPILIPSAALWAFARSLRPGETPLVTRIATQIRGPLPDELRRYTRSVTQGWVGLLAALALGSLLLAVFASPELWSLMTNIVLYLLLGAVFLLEYAYRRRRFRHLEHEGFGRMVRALFKLRTL